MDHARNQMLSLNLILTLFTVSLSVGAVVTGAFGEFDFILYLL
jgi:hypothetical protein